MIEMVEKTASELLIEIVKLRKRIIFLQKEYINLLKEGKNETISS